MEWQDRLNAAIRMIEENLDGEVNLEEVAAEANCSSFHFSRMFEVILGMTLGDYVRRRRLSKAASELTQGKARVIDVALRYGYESPDAFAKAFRRLFGCTPSEAREEGRTLASYPPIAFTVALKGDRAMNYRIETKAAFSLVGPWFRATSEQGENFKTVPAFWERVMSTGEFQKLCALMPQGSALGVCGVCAEDDPATGEFSYLTAIETPADRSEIPPEWKVISVPAVTWGIFEARGPLPGSIQDTWKRIFSEWFPGSPWECERGPQIEVYATGDSRAPDYYSEVWIPLKKK